MEDDDASTQREDMDTTDPAMKAYLEDSEGKGQEDEVTEVYRDPFHLYHGDTITPMDASQDPFENPHIYTTPNFTPNLSVDLPTYLGDRGIISHQREEQLEEVMSAQTSRHRKDSVNSNGTMADESSENESTASQIDSIDHDSSLQNPFESNANLRSSTPDPNLNVTKSLETVFNISL